MKHIYVISKRDSNFEWDNVAYAETLEKAKDYIRGRTLVRFDSDTNNSDQVSASCPDDSFLITKKELL